MKQGFEEAHENIPLAGVSALPTTPDSPGVHRPLLPKVLELRQHAPGGGGRVLDPPHSVTHMCNVVTRRCDTNILM